MTKYDDKVKKNTSQGRLQSTIRVFLILMSLVFLLNFVSAEETFQFDNVKQYDAELQKVTIVNTFGIGRTIADIKLNTPLNNKLMWGYQKVAEFNINSYDDSYTSALKEIKTYDYHNLKNELKREFDYKVLTYENYEVNDYKEVCGEDLLSKNGSLSCIYKVVGTHTEQKEVWVDFDTSIIYKGNYTIGIFTEVYIGDKVEWIPNFYGVKVDEWASWESLIVNYSNFQVFNTTGSQTFTVPAGVEEVAILIVGGGGAGGWVEGNGERFGGGGGAGGVIYNSSYVVTPAQEITVVVGAGGNSTSERVYNGTASHFGTLIAFGGGGGGAGSSNEQYAIGARGGSGGGGGLMDGYGDMNGGSANQTTGYGNNGIASSDASVYSGGGGGAGSVGSTTTGGSGIEIWNLIWGVGGAGESGSGSVEGASAENQTGNGGAGSKRTTGGTLSGGMGGTGVVIVAWEGITNPAVTLTAPDNYANLTNPLIIFNTTVYEYNEGGKITNVTLFIDGVLNETDTSEVNGSYSFTKTLSEGKHNWSILAFNNNSLSNQSETRDFWVDTTPLVTLDAPVNYANLTYNNIHFNTTVHSVYDIANVSFYLNGTLNETDTTGINGSYVFEKYLVDGYYNWSIVAYSSLGGGNTSATRTLTIDTIAPSITIVYPLNITYNTTLASENNISIWFNWTVSDANLDMCWWSNDSGATNNTISCNANSSEYWTYGQKSFIAWANDTLGNLGVARRTATWAYFSLVSATSYNAASYETRNETFYLNLTIGSMITKISPYLLYNGTYYAADSSCSGMLCQISRKIDIPLLTSSSLDSENKSFLWQVTTFGDFGTSNENTTSYNQNVSGISFTNSGCVANYNASVNFTIYNETTNALMNAGFRGTFKYWLGDGTVKDSYNFTGEGQNHYLFCVDKNLSYLTDSEIAINATTNNRIYQFVKEIYSNSTKTQKLFIPDDAYTNTIIIEVKDQGLTPLPNIIVNISRYYPGIDKYEVVEHRTTDEFGQIITKIIQYDVKYKFNFYNSAGVLLKESDKVTIICRTAYCVVPFIIETTSDYLQRYDNLTSFSYELSFDNTSNIFTYSWIDQTGENAIHRLEVTRYHFNGSTTVCNSTSTTTVSSLNCSLGSQSATYTAQAFRRVAGKFELRVSYLQSIVGDYSQTFGIEGLFWVFILLMVGIGIGIYNPSVGAIIYGTGFIFMGILKIIYMPLPVFFANTLLVVLFVWAVKT